MLRTKKAKSSARMTAAQDDARRGLIIKRGIVHQLRTWRPLLACQEGAAGSMSARGAAALARAQQACVDAVDQVLRSDVLFCTVQAAKKACTGRNSGSKAEIEAAVRKYWHATDWDELLKGITASKRENAFDAAAVVMALDTNPAVVSLRRAA